MLCKSLFQVKSIKNQLILKAVVISFLKCLNIDIDQSKYTFKDNKALLNQLPLEFKGFIQLVDEGQLYDLTFNTPTSSFKNFLGIVPSAYSGSMDNIKTSGDFTVAGFAKGTYSDTTIPTFDIVIASNNASFKFPDLPKSVDNIVIDAKIKNETGLMKDIFLNLDQLSFKIDQDVFNAKATVKNLTENALVDAFLKGTINLGNLSKAYPIKIDTTHAHQNQPPKKITSISYVQSFNNTYITITYLGNKLCHKLNHRRIITKLPYKHCNLFHRHSTLVITTEYIVY